MGLGAGTPGPLLVLIASGCELSGGEVLHLYMLTALHLHPASRILYDLHLEMLDSRVMRMAMYIIP